MGRLHRKTAPEPTSPTRSALRACAARKKQRRGLSVFQLKVIGAVALVLSAGSTTLVPLISDPTRAT